MLSRVRLAVSLMALTLAAGCAAPSGDDSSVEASEGAIQKTDFAPVYVCTMRGADTSPAAAIPTSAIVVPRSDGGVVELEEHLGRTLGNDGKYRGRWMTDDYDVTLTTKGSVLSFEIAPYEIAIDTGKQTGTFRRQDEESDFVHDCRGLSYADWMKENTRTLLPPTEQFFYAERLDLATAPQALREKMEAASKDIDEDARGIDLSLSARFYKVGFVGSIPTNAGYLVWVGTLTGGWENEGKVWTVGFDPDGNEVMRQFGELRQRDKNTR